MRKEAGEVKRLLAKKTNKKLVFQLSVFLQLRILGALVSKEETL